MILLPTAYFGNVQYFSKLLSGEPVLIEAHENYTKQSFRNRCDILSSNGPTALSIPILKEPDQEKVPIRDVRIDYSLPWQQQHWRSLMAAYGSSPYFGFFDYILEPLFLKKEKFLFDHNNSCLERVLGCMGIKASFGLTQKYAAAPDGALDYRSSISPKASQRRSDPFFRAAPYHQVFSEKFAFCENLSILDLLFCEGSNAPQKLKNSYVWRDMNP